MAGAGSEPHGSLSERLHAILSIYHKMSSVRERAALLELIAQEAPRLMDADRASIFLLDRERQELWSHVALGLDEPLRFAAHLGLAGTVIQSGQPVNVTDAPHDPRFYPGIDTHTGYHTRSLLAVPLRTLDGELIGVFEVLNKRGGPFTEADEELLKALATPAAIALETAEMVEALRRHRDQLLKENAQLWQEVEGRRATQGILGSSPKIQALVRVIEQIRDSTVTVLITGESGTGKELVARAVHASSPRARGPFVALNCAALPESLVESELFGIERGVATGVERRMGQFEAAHGGTLFLDEVGDLSLPAQAKLLRALQERVIERVGGRKPIPVDVRILAATNKNLEAASHAGTFRPDLYYRLEVIHIQMPPLREMLEDIPLLANHFLATYSRELEREPLVLTPPALRGLQAYPWPGNVRELENEMKRLVVSVRGRPITEADLSEALRRQEQESAAPARGLKAAVSELEKRLIREALQECRGNQLHAAQALGLSRQGLIKKMKRYDLKASP